MTDQDLPPLERQRIDELHQLGAMTGMSLVRNVLTTWLDELPANVDRIREAIHTGDAAALKFSAHGLKASSAQIGAVAVASACLALEHASPADASPLLARLEHEVERVTPLLMIERDAEPPSGN